MMAYIQNSLILDKKVSIKRHRIETIGVNPLKNLVPRGFALTIASAFFAFPIASVNIPRHHKNIYFHTHDQKKLIAG
jgi:hypothetical protein